jgi:hypothetical protein
MNMEQKLKDKAMAACFDFEEKNGVYYVTVKGLPQEILGMESGSLHDLWQFLSRQDKNPADVLLFQLNNGLLGPTKFNQMMAEYGICSADGLQWNKEKIEKYRYYFLREVHTTHRIVRRFVTIDSFVVFSLSGEMLLSLFGGALACDYRIVADDFVLINQINRSVFSPIGGLPWFLTRILGRTGAWKLLREKRKITAEEALELGLVDCIVPHDRIKAESQRIAEEFAMMPWGCRVGLKRAMVATGESLDRYLEVEDEAFCISMNKVG